MAERGRSTKFFDEEAEMLPVVEETAIVRKEQGVTETVRLHMPVNPRAEEPRRHDP